LGGKALAAIAPLQGLLDDPAARVRFSAAAAMLRISPSDERSTVVLANGLKSSAPTDCRDAAQAVGLAGASATSLTSTLAALLNPVSDNSVRVAALQALATLGPAASAAAPAMVPLLKEPDFAIDAAEALGRIGPAARPVPAELVQMLSSKQPAVRWAAVRSMAQIGGVESRPAVGFIIAELPKAPEIEAYNMLVYLALLGPEAKDAAPVVRNLRVMLNPMLRPATLWAIDPERNFPWQNEATFGMPQGSGGRPDEPGDGGPPGGGRRGPGGPGGMIDGDGPNLARFIYEAYFHELGNRLAPTTEKLIKQIMDGTAGEIPAWGYHLLNCTPEVSVRSFVAQLSSDDLVLRERATVALGYMGRPAIAANDQLSATRNKTSNERERRLIEWALREINAP
jgi:HEAT repeat protein